MADLIKQQLDQGIALGHQCVLFRSSYLSIPLQSELSKRNIPYETYGGLKFYETAHVALTRAKKRCFLTLHHEGVRGGITQFNKISRFVDVPNVLSKLEFRDIARQEMRELPEKEMQEVPPLYDKKHLLERLMNFYKQEN